jgi:hypothetical protein
MQVVRERIMIQVVFLRKVSFGTIHEHPDPESEKGNYYDGEQSKNPTKLLEKLVAGNLFAIDLTIFRENLCGSNKKS